MRAKMQTDWRDGKERLKTLNDLISALLSTSQLDMLHSPQLCLLLDSWNNCSLKEFLVFYCSFVTVVSNILRQSQRNPRFAFKRELVVEHTLNLLEIDKI
mmetsp:Transcript_104119/g.224780  ORF Transcript_104119/g.224780 Transcript_104119/m.224780 type:complete len:100 (-) Transcript_104119:1314-1613(-)